MDEPIRGLQEDAGNVRSRASPTLALPSFFYTKKGLNPTWSPNAFSTSVFDI